MSRKGILQLVLLGAVACASLSASAQEQGPYLNHLDIVDTQALPALDLQRLAEEDRTDALLGNPPRFAVPVKADITTKTDGTWEEYDRVFSIWRYRVKAEGATSLNFGFGRFQLPPSAKLTIWSADGKSKLGPYTAADNRGHGELWTPVIPTNDAVIELRIVPAERNGLVLALTQIGHGYRGFHDAMNAKSGACNMDVNCLTASEPWASWRETARSVGTYSLGGSTLCTGSLMNTSRNDKDMLFVTARHCGVNDTTDASIVVYWNYEQSTCRTPGGAASGQAGDGPTNMTTSGSTHLATAVSSDFTVVRLSSAANPAWNLYWNGWDRNSADRDCGPEPENLCAGIHHPSTDEKRITFVEADFVPRSYNNPTPPGDGTHWWARWDPTPIFPPNPGQTIPPQVTEGGSSGSPLYTKEQRFIGQLHGGPSACGATGNNLSDYYGRLSVSWEGGGTATTRARDHLDPDNTGAMTQDGRGECTAPAVPVIGTATATAPNTIQVTWTASAGAERYRVYRANGTCAAATNYVFVGEATSSPYTDATVSGGQTYSYQVTAVDDGESCESPRGTCVQATATGACTTAPTFAGIGNATSAGTTSCGINVTWSAGTASCGGAVQYNVYRSTTPGFTPSAANAIQTCATATSLSDTAVTAGTPYYYIVRAEDLAATGGAGRCGGREDANVIEDSAAAFGPDAVSFSDDVEGGTTNWTTTGTGAVGANFAVVTTQAHSPTHSWFAVQPTNISDRQLNTASPVTLPAGSNATLSFWHRFDMEAAASTPTLGYDGGVLEYSLDGTTWVDILAANGPVPADPTRFIVGGYTRGISTDFESPIGGRQAWSGTNGAAFTEVRVDLGDFGGQSVRFRFRFASDESASATGWWIDDVSIAQGTACGGAAAPDPLFEDGFEEASTP